MSIQTFKTTILSLILHYLEESYIDYKFKETIYNLLDRDEEFSLRDIIDILNLIDSELCKQPTNIIHFPADES